MRVTRVQPVLCHAGIRNWVFAKAETDEGLVGYGEGTDWPGERAIATAIEELAPYVEGENPLDTEFLWNKMYSAMYAGGKTINCAISAIDNALWDIAGKAAGVPVYVLLGGKCRDRIRLYCHCDAFEEKDNVAAVARRSEEIGQQGFTAVKTHPSTAGTWRWRAVRLDRHMDSQTIRNTGAKIEAIRKTLGEDVGIAIDLNNLLDVPSAIALARHLEPFDLMFVEDPVRQDEGPRDILRVRESTKCPIATGENLYNIWGFRQYLEMGAVDVLTLDLCHCGGMTQAVKIAALASAYHVPIAPHNPNGPLATAISTHFCASIPNFRILETWHPDVPWLREVVTHPPQIANGYLELPHGPGWGCDLVESRISEHPYERGHVFNAWLS